MKFSVELNCAPNQNYEIFLFSTDVTTGWRVRKKERKKERKDRRIKGRNKEQKVRSGVFFVIYKERKKESCDLLLTTSKWRGKENRKVVGKAGWQHYGTVSSVLEFGCLAKYLLNRHWQQQETEKKRKWAFINDTNNLIFQIIFKKNFLQYHRRYFSFIDLFFLDSEIFSVLIIKKIFYIKFNCYHWRVYSNNNNDNNTQSKIKRK